jgi:ribosome-associated toxin RatA of RatAB toxin-antitoxin module
MYDAVLRVGLPGLSSSSLVEERYISRVRMISPSVVEDTDGNMPLWIVEAKSIQSKLFDSLKSRWQLALEDNRYNIHDRGVMNLEDNTMTRHNTATSSCNVRFEVEIQVSNPLVSLVLDQVLKDVAKKQVDAFERRGNEIPFRQDRVVFR